jgi:hypothetical protein
VDRIWPSNPIKVRGDFGPAVEQTPNRKPFTPSYPGLPLRLPWVGNGLSPNRNAVAPDLIRRRTGATALRLGNHLHS